MNRFFAKPRTLALTLLVLTAIPILVSAVRLYQIPAGALPEASARFAAVPFAHFAHALGGVLFGILGPIQFAGVLRRRFGWWHRVTGRVFVAAGAALSLASFRLLWEFPEAASGLLSGARLAAGVALAAALVLAMTAIRRRDIEAHKAWMIRAYAVGMGSGTVALLLFPIILIFGHDVAGPATDAVFVGSWAANIALAEWVIRRGRPRAVHLLRQRPA